MKIQANNNRKNPMRMRNYKKGGKRI